MKMKFLIFMTNTIRLCDKFAEIVHERDILYVSCICQYVTYVINVQKM